MDLGFFGLSWDTVWMAKLSFSSATLSSASGSHPVCHAPATREDGLGSETNVTKALWLKILWWSCMEQGIAQQGIADGAGTGDCSMAWKAGSLSSGLLTCAHFSVLACLPRTLSPEILRKKLQLPIGHQAPSESLWALHISLQFALFKLPAQLKSQQQKNYYEESSYISC